MSVSYQIKSYNFLLHDEKSVKFHVESGDYFGTLATILSLYQKQNKWPESYPEIHDDLMNLQKNYYIKKRAK